MDESFGYVMSDHTECDCIDADWKVPEPTQIPEMDGSLKILAGNIWLMLPHGTIAPDTIMVVSDGQGNYIMSPTSEIGGFMARTGHTNSVIAEQEAWVEQLRRYTDDEDDEEGSGPVMFEP